MGPFLSTHAQKNDIYFVFLFPLLDLFFCQLQQKLDQISE